MEPRRLNALEKYERPESKSDGYCQKSFYRQQRDDCKTKKLTKHTKQCIQITQLYKMRKTGPASPKGSGAAGKARNPEKRAFSLPYISYNLHYTKYYKNQKQRPPSPALRHRCRFWEPLLFFYIISFGTCGLPAKQASQNTAGQDRFHASVHCIRLYSGVSSGCVPKYAQTAS